MQIELSYFGNESVTQTKPEKPSKKQKLAVNNSFSDSCIIKIYNIKTNFFINNNLNLSR